MRMWVPLALLSGFRIWHCCERQCKSQMLLRSSLVLLWLWCMLAVVAPIQPLAWKLPYAVVVALKKGKGKRKEKERKEERKKERKKILRQDKIRAGWDAGEASRVPVLL